MSACIVVGTDLSVTADSALMQAARRAEQDDARLIVVHAVAPSGWRNADARAQVDELRGQVCARVESLCSRREGQYDVVVEQGEPHLVLARIGAQHSALLVVAGKAKPTAGHARLRDVGERLVHGGYGPVLIARPTTGSGPVLVALDRPVYSTAAHSLPVAAHEQRRRDARLLVLHCLNEGFLETLLTDLVNGGAYAPEPLGRGSLVAEAYRELESEVHRYGLTAETRVLHGQPEQVIPRLAVEVGADLIIVGPARHPGHSDAIAAVLHEAPCSVLVLDPSATLRVESHAANSREPIPEQPQLH